MHCRRDKERRRERILEEMLQKKKLSKLEDRNRCTIISSSINSKKDKVREFSQAHEYYNKMLKLKIKF